MNLPERCEFSIKAARELGADEAEAFADSGRETTVGIENNDLKTGKSQTHHTLGLRVFRSHALGFAAVNDLSDESLRSAAQRAVDLAAKAPPDKDNGLASKQPLNAVHGVYDPDAEGFRSQDAVEAAAALLRAATDVDARVVVSDGMVSAVVGEKAIATTAGIEAHERESGFFAYVFGMAVDGQEVSNFDFQFDGARRWRDILVDPLARRFAERVVASLGARRTESFVGPVVLSPYAADVILEPLLFALNGHAVYKGMSRFAGLVGKEVAAPSVTVEDDGLLPGGLATSSFDREGVPHARRVLVERGVLRGYLLHTYAGRKLSADSTGHAAGDARSVPTVGPTNLMLAAGDTAKDDMIRDIAKGIYVTRFSGASSPTSGDFSGVVKGGFLIENGQLTTPMKETTIAGNAFEALTRVTAVSEEREKVFTTLLPHVRIDGLSITAGSGG